MQGGPDLARLHLTFRLWQALQAPPRRLRVGCRLVAGVVRIVIAEYPRGMWTWRYCTSRRFRGEKGFSLERPTSIILGISLVPRSVLLVPRPRVSPHFQATYVHLTGSC